MTNFEHYKDEILQIVHSYKGGIALVNNIIQPCMATACNNCDFHKHCHNVSCSAPMFEWLYSEHKPLFTLTKQEHALCLIAETGYVARDKMGTLYWHKTKPRKRESDWMSTQWSCIDWKSLHFDCIQWEDDEPWSVEDLLKLQVKE